MHASLDPAGTIQRFLKGDAKAWGNKAFQQKVAFPHAGSTVISFDRSEGGFNGLVYVEAFLVNEVVQALAVELTLNFREDRFDRVEFW